METVHNRFLHVTDMFLLNIYFAEMFYSICFQMRYVRLNGLTMDLLKVV